MPSYAEIIAAAKEEEATVAQATPEETVAQPEAGFLSGVRRGLFRSPADVLALTPMGQRPDTSQLPATLTLDAVRNAPTFAQTQDEILTGASGEPEPTTFLGRAGERLGRRAPFFAATAPALGALGAAAGGTLGATKAIAAETAAEVASGITGQIAEDAGLGPTGQIVTETLTGALAPAGVPRQAATRTTSRGARLAQEVGRRQFARSVGTEIGAPPMTVDQLADLSGASARVARRAVREIQDRIASPEKSREALRKGRVDFPDKASRPSPAALLGKQGGENIPALEKSTSRRSPKFSVGLTRRKNLMTERLDAEYERLLPEGSVGRVNEGSNQLLSKVQNDVRRAWKDAGVSELPEAPVRSLKRIADGMKRRFHNPDNIPGEIKGIERIAGEGDTISGEQLHNLLSELLTTQRLGSDFGASDVARKRAAAVNELITEARRLFDSMPEEGTSAYMRARRATKDLHALFDTDSKGIRAILDVGDEQKLVSAFRSSKNPLKDVQAVRKVLKQVDGGEDSLARVFIDDLFIGDPADITPRTVRRKLRLKGDMYQAALGRKKLAEVRGFLERADTARRFSAGTPAAIRETGSNVVDTLLGVTTETFVSPVQSGKRGLAIAARRALRIFDNDEAMQVVMREILSDDDLLEAAIGMPKGKEIADWIRNLRRLAAGRSVPAGFVKRATPVLEALDMAAAFAAARIRLSQKITTRTSRSAISAANSQRDAERESAASP